MQVILSYKILLHLRYVLSEILRNVTCSIINVDVFILSYETNTVVKIFHASINNGRKRLNYFEELSVFVFYAGRRDVVPYEIGKEIVSVMKTVRNRFLTPRRTQVPQHITG